MMFQWCPVVPAQQSSVADRGGWACARPEVSSSWGSTALPQGLLASPSKASLGRPLTQATNHGMSPACCEPPSSLYLTLSPPRSTRPLVRKSKSFFSPGQALTCWHCKWLRAGTTLFLTETLTNTVSTTVRVFCSDCSQWMEFSSSPCLVLPLNRMQRWQGLYCWHNMTCCSETVASLWLIHGRMWMRNAARLVVAWEGHREEGTWWLACPGPPLRLFGPTSSVFCCYRFESKYPNQKSPVKYGASSLQVHDSHLVNGVLGVCVHSLWIF